MLQLLSNGLLSIGLSTFTRNVNFRDRKVRHANSSQQGFGRKKTS